MKRDVLIESSDVLTEINVHKEELLAHLKEIVFYPFVWFFLQTILEDQDHQ